VCFLGKGLLVYNAPKFVVVDNSLNAAAAFLAAALPGRLPILALLGKLLEFVAVFDTAGSLFVLLLVATEDAKLHE
jgi:hypothetical protein